MSMYWVDGPVGCPMGGPFDLWRQSYFRTNGEPPEDTSKMYPGVSGETVIAVAVATVNGDATLDNVLTTFGDQGPSDRLAMAHAYFSEWRKNAPSMPDKMQHIERRYFGSEPELLAELP